ncbi:MinD/ParA family protein [Gracilibacillus alcaliphilus]|uniref:MinD/ParA family protein n=1 Tax=Gracilibacillus alcaliphilus TaxID=1401441 RepID=UPI001958F05A|nr:MinD/ParA family protein [Gracilibacillus alcaliphilus]MBM7677953.1 flagellar biosynthesis protein FlhG [Gracilibacillus alcaliphilus]
MTDQAEQLRRKLQDSHAVIPQAKTLAIVSGKGGVGKSNIAINFSLLLAKRSKKVLLIDLDIGMGNIDILLGTNAKYSISHLFEQKVTFFDMIETGPNCLDFIAGGSGLNEIFQLNQQKLTFFIQQLEQAVKTYDYIIFDMGAGVTRDTIEFMKAVDECILVTTPEPTSITDAYSMIKHVLMERETAFHVIVNRTRNAKQGIEVSNRLIGVVKRFLNQSIHPLGSVPDDEAVVNAVIAQEPFVLHQHNSRAAKALESIAKQYLNEPVEPTNRSGFIRRLKRIFTER